MKLIGFNTGTFTILGIPIAGLSKTDNFFETTTTCFIFFTTSLKICAGCPGNSGRTVTLTLMP